MSKHTHRSQRLFGTAFMTLGLVVSLGGSQNALQGQVLSPDSLGQGSVVTSQSATAPVMARPTYVHAAAATEDSNPLGVIAFGMLMMLIGFGAHAFATLRTTEQNVPVTIRETPKQPAPQKKKASGPLQVIWIERNIRL